MARAADHHFEIAVSDPAAAASPGWSSHSERLISVRVIEPDPQILDH
jgi:hypothetical protein